MKNQVQSTEKPLSTPIISSLALAICGRTKDKSDGIFCIDTLRDMSVKTGIPLSNLIIDNIENGKLSPKIAKYATYTEIESIEIYRTLALKKSMTPDLWRLYCEAFNTLIVIEVPDKTIHQEADYFKFLAKFMKIDCPFFELMGEELLNFLILSVEDDEGLSLTLSLGKSLGGKGLQILIQEEFAVRDVDSEDLIATGN